MLDAAKDKHVNGVAPDELWSRIVAHQGQTFRQIRGGEFSYTVEGNVVYPDRTNRCISRRNFERALELMPLSSTVPLHHLQAPSYIYAIMTDPRIGATEAEADTTSLEEAARLLRAFCNGRTLGTRLSKIESSLVGAHKESAIDFLCKECITGPVLNAALIVKSLAGEINVTIHALGILLSLPHIMEPGEKVVCASLGAGNTGKRFDLETDRRLAEFKFISWQGGPEAIRQNQLFKDFFYLAEAEGDKRRQLFVLGTYYPLRFLSGNRALNSVLSRNNGLREDFYAKYDDRYTVVSQYYSEMKHLVEIVDLTEVVPAFRRNPMEVEDYGEGAAE